MSYPRAMGTAQASWSQIGPGMGAGPVIYGTDGTILVHQRSGSREGQLIKEGTIEVMTRELPDGALLEPPELPVGQRNAIEHFTTCLREDMPFNDVVSPVTGRDVQEILEAGYLSLANGHDVTLPLLPGSHSHCGAH